MKYLRLEKSEIKPLFKRLFALGKKEIVFLASATVLLLLFVFIIIPIFIKQNFSRMPDYFDIIYIVITFGALFIYKLITKCDEFHFLKLIFLVSIWMVIASIIVDVILIIMNVHSEILYMIPVKIPIAELISLPIDQLRIFIKSIVEAFGLMYLFYNKINYKEIILVAAGFTIIYMIPNLSQFVYHQTLIYPIKIISLMTSIIYGIILFYSFKELKQYILTKNKELNFFMVLGLLITVLAFIVKIINIDISTLISWNITLGDIILTSLNVFEYYLLAGVFIYLYNRYIHKFISEKFH